MTSLDGGYYPGHQSYRGTFDQRVFEQAGGPAMSADGQAADRVTRWTAGLDKSNSNFNRGTSGNLGGAGGGSAGQNGGGSSRQGSMLDSSSMGGGGGGGGGDPPQQQHPHVSGQAFVMDQWVYKDPQGMMQGPFTKVRSSKVTQPAEEVLCL